MAEGFDVQLVGGLFDVDAADLILHSLSLGWLSRLPVLPSLDALANIDALVAAGEAHGWLADADLAMVPGESGAGFLVDLVGKHTPAAHGGLVYPPYAGVLGNGTDAYVDTGVPGGGGVGVNSTPTRIWFGAYGLLNVRGATFEFSANGPGGVRNALRFCEDNGNNAVWPCSGTKVVTHSNAPVGWHEANRDDDAQVIIGLNGSFIPTPSPIDPVNVPDSNFMFFKNGAGVVSSPQNICAAYIGKNKPEDVRRLWYGDLVTFLVAMGTISDDDTDNSPVVGPNVWAPADVARIGTPLEMVLRTGPPPMSVDDGITEVATAPATGYSEGPGAFANWEASTWPGGMTASGVDTGAWHPRYWAHSSDFRATTGIGLKPSPIGQSITTVDVREARNQFTSIPKSQGATEGQILQQLGADERSDPTNPFGEGWHDVFDRSEVTGVPWPDLDADADLAFGSRTYFIHEAAAGGYICSNDIVPLYDVPTFAFGTVWIDAEEGDARPPETRTADVKRLADISHAFGKKFGIYGNAADANSQANNGFGASNWPEIINYPNVDYVPLVMEPGNSPTAAAAEAEFERQIALFGADPPIHKILLVVGLGPPGGVMPLESALAIRAKIVSYGIKNVYFWPKRGVQGGEVDVNAVIAAILGIDPIAQVDGSFTPYDLGANARAWIDFDRADLATEGSGKLSAISLALGSATAMLAQGTFADEPALVSVADLNAVQGDGAAVFIDGDVPANVITQAVPGTMDSIEFGLLVNTGDQTGLGTGVLLAIGGTATGTYIEVRHSAANAIQATNGSVTAAISAVAPGIHVIWVRVSPTDIWLSVDGGTEDHQAATSNNIDGTGKLRLLANRSATPASFAKDKIQSVLFATALSSTPRAQSIAWFAWRAAIEANLPMADPYRTVRP